MDFFNRVAAIFTGPEVVDISSRFTILKEAISGTMSKFHMARDNKTNKIVGLKLLDPEQTSAFEGRFTGLNKPSEGEISLALKHPRLMETFEYGTAKDGRLFLVMEYLEGTGLNQLIYNRDPKLRGKCVPLIKQMAEAIEAVHAAGYIHRDICPRNFIIAPDYKSLKLIDFGLTLPATEKFMQPGNRTGTPNYMAPEIVRRRPTDQRVDIFALGVTAYQTLAWELPWPGGDVTGKAALQHDSRPPTPIREHRPTLNPQLAEAIMSCLSRDPAGRPADATAFLRALRNVTSEESA